LTPPERLGALARLAQALDALGLVYVVGGSLASARWGIPRLTNDVDVVIDLPPDRLEPLLDGLEDGFYVDRLAAESAARQKGSFNVISRGDFTKVDVFVHDGSPWQRSQLARRRLERLPETVSPDPVYLSSAEDTVLAKLVWFEKGHRVSDRQWRDVLGVLRVQGPSLDMAYLQSWAEAQGVSDLLAQALRAAGPRPPRP
jgi:hypothetical protein